MGRFNGIKYSGALKTNSRDFKRLKVRRSIDLMELEDRGTIAEGKSDLPTRGAAHRRHRDGGRRGARGATVNTVDLGYVSGIGSNVVDNQDFGLISETALTYNQTINQQRFGSLDEVTTDSVNTPVWNPNANTTTFVVTVGPKTGGGNAFYLDSGSGPVEAPAITLYYGQNYIFDVSDSSNNGHPFAFTIDDGVSEYKRGIARIGSPGQDKAKVRITIPNGNAISGMTNFKYYCTVHGTGMGNTINLTQFVPTYTITPAANNVDEGSTLGFTVNTDDNISVLYWNVVGYTPPVFSTPDMNGGSGSFAIHQNGTGFFNTGTILEDRTTEGAETFSIEFRTGSSTGPVVATSDLITINDTSDDSDNAGSYSWSISTSIDASNPPTNPTPLASGQPNYIVNTDVTNSNYHGQLHEGSNMTWSATTDAPDGVQVYFLVASTYLDYANPNTDDPSYPDITATPGTYGWLTASNGQVSGSITAIEDLIAESGEMKQIWLMASPTDYSNVLAESQWFHINDNPEPTYSLSADNTTINEGDTVTFTLTTTNVVDGTNIAYTVTGIDANDLSAGSLTGNITVNSNTGTAAFTLAEDATTEGQEVMTLTLDNGGGALDVVITDSSTTPAVTSADFSNTTLAYTLDNPNAYGTSANDFFGYSVSISDTHAIVGAYAEDDTSVDVPGSGKAYIYDTSDGSLAYTLDNPNAYDTSDGDSFGQSVSISSTHAIVGAYNEDDAGGTSSGKAYIYDLSDGSLAYTLDNPNAYSTSQNDYFGLSVSISDTHAIVGAYGEDDAGGITSGKAYIYDLSDGSLAHTLDNPNAYDTSVGDRFGANVSISSTHAIVSAHFEDDAGGGTSGKAYIFDVTTGNLVYTLDNPNAYDTSAIDRFGNSVSISDSHAIVGAFYEDDAGGSGSGKAYIFDLSDGSLVYTLDNPNAHGTSATDYFGYSVSISDTYAIVGAYNEDDSGGSGSGKAYIFDLSDGSLVYTLDNPTSYGTSQNDRFGYSVSISNTHAIAGAYFEDDAGGTSSGKAYIFTGVADFSSDFSISSSVTQNFLGDQVAITGGYLIATRKVTEGLIANGEAVIYDSSGEILHTILNPGDTDANEDWFGSSVDISLTYSIVGAKRENLTNTREGIAYIFRNTTGELVHTLNNPNDDLGGLIPSTTTESDEFGNSVAISDTYSVVGAEYADNYSGNTASNCGRIYVFDNSDGSLVYNLSHPSDAPISFGTPFAVDSRLGHKVAINNTYVAASAVGWNNNTYHGRVYIWNLSDGSLEYTLDNPNNFGTSSTDYFGSSIAFSDTHLIVGAENEDSADGNGSGTAYVYDLSDGSLVHSIVNPNTTGSSSGDKFGSAVGINSEKIYVGAGNEDDGFGNSGKIYVFNLSDGVLSDTIANPLPAGTNFGRKLQVKGSNMIAGHPYANSGGGAFYVYTGL